MAKRAKVDHLTVPMLQRSTEPFSIRFECDVQSKKNNYRRSKGGGMFKPDHVVETEMIALSQIPAEYIGLKLKHPAIILKADMPKKNMAADIDGIFTTILDYLVKAEVLADDCIRQCNGMKFIDVVHEAPSKSFEVTILPDGDLKGWLLDKWDTVEHVWLDNG